MVQYSKAMMLAAMTAAGGLVVVATAPQVQAAPVTELQFDLNCLSIQSSGPSGPVDATNYATFTGTFQFSKNVSSELNMYLDGVHLTSLTGPFQGISGQIGFLNGNFLGGDMIVSVQNVANPLLSDTYTFHMEPSTSIHLFKSTYASSYRAYGFLLDSDTNNGAFNGSSFGGVDVTVFHNQEPLAGAFMQLKYRPDANGLSNASDVDIFTRAEAVPLPASVTGGLVLAGLLGAVQYAKARKNSQE